MPVFIGRNRYSGCFLPTLTPVEPYKLGQYVETKDNHKTVVLIGNEPKGVWKKAFGLANADELIKLVEEVLKEK